MDVVYPLGKKSRWDNNELRYSLRSIEKHLTGVDKIYIVGERPDFLQNVIHIPYEDTYACKETNIYKKVLRACQEESLSQEFLFFNDDHFILRDFNVDEFPFFYKSDLYATIQKLRPTNRYRKYLDKTMRVLHSLRLPTKNFDTHTPIIYNKQTFLEIMPKYDWEHRIGYVVKSLYANTLRIEGQREPDCKIGFQFLAEECFNIIKDRKVFSIGDAALGPQLEVVLNHLYPNKSKWEK